jgi:arabinofuranosyltransferase
VLLLTIAGAAGLSLEHSSVWIGLVMTIVGLSAGIAGAWVLNGRGFALPIGAVAVASVAAMWDFATSGLESGLSFGWLGLTFLLVAVALTNGRFARTALVFTGLGPLVRPDLGLFSAAFFGTLLVAYWLRSHGSWRTRLSALVAPVVTAAAIPVLYQLFRMGYFAAVIPNTAIAKEAGAEYWSQGQLYLRDFADTYRLALVLPLLLGLWASRWLGPLLRRDFVTTAAIVLPTLAGLCHAFYVTKAGGDFMHGRLLLPALFGGLLPLFALPLPRHLLGRVASVVAMLLVVGWAGSTAATAQPKGNPEAGIDSELRNLITAEDYRSNGWAGEGRRLRQRADERIASGDTGPRPLLGENFGNRVKLRADIDPRIQIGAIGQVIGITGAIAGPDVLLIDRLGLGDPLASRLIVEKRGRPGHEKALPDFWVQARWADPALNESQAEMEARAVLQCGEMRELLLAITEPMSVGRFLTNVVRAWSLTQLRFYPDPDGARMKLCPPTP